MIIALVYADALVAYEMFEIEEEHLRILLLDTSNWVLETFGSITLVTSSQVHTGELFYPAIRHDALVRIHVHPSLRDPTPSPDSVVVMRAIVQTRKMLDVDVFNNMVIKYTRWDSFNIK